MKRIRKKLLTALVARFLRSIELHKISGEELMFLYGLLMNEIIKFRNKNDCKYCQEYFWMTMKALIKKV